MAASNNANNDASIEWVRLISADEHEFYVHKRVAVNASKTIRMMLEGSFREAHENEIRFPDISGYILEKVVAYLHYRTQHEHSTARIPEFPIEPEAALELLVAAKYLDC